jgi:hypothetical protein
MTSSFIFKATKFQYIGGERLHPMQLGTDFQCFPHSTGSQETRVRGPSSFSQMWKQGSHLSDFPPTGPLEKHAGRSGVDRSQMGNLATKNRE